MGKLIDAETGFAAAGVASDAPTTAKLFASPCQLAEPCDMRFSRTRSQHQPEGDDGQQNSVAEQDGFKNLGQHAPVERIDWNEINLHHHAFPMR